MSTPRWAVMVVWLLAGTSLAAGQDTRPAGIDWQKARALHQKELKNQPLTPEEKAYLDKAKAELRAGRGPGKGPAGQGRNAPAPTTQRSSTGMVPLNQMTADDRYKGEDGGLYGKGENAPPKQHMEAARKALARIEPLDKDGKPSAEGKIVLLSVGMSNTTNEFSVFKATADRNPQKNPRLVIVDGAQGGQAAKQWNSADCRVWPVVQQRLAQAGVTPKQVQVVWLKQAQQNPAAFGEFPGHARELKGDIIKDIQQVKAHYPNVQVLYLSSRIYAGYATTSLNPEPYAYESAFAVRWIIQDQMKGSAELNYDPARGAVKVPVLLWGPYLWTDGLAGRTSDGMVWKPEDCRSDGTHPSASGAEKVTRLLINFFKNDPASGDWFTGKE